ncbi:response regulator transcription factor [Clostridiisalibacter paucivorans]|uniref:response regulator transcription factor n=1 Tax=Clostridiisalibacter paucivorans TaxID=408753 RepID=UPI00047EF0F4|nr:response regulator [Clostridiisalibacter paucivorans]
MKILIVDDSIFSQKITGTLLKKEIKDVELYFAADGEEGFKKFRLIDPDYVFVDLLMPRMNGKELTKAIKEYDSEAKIIILSADVQKSVKIEMEEYNIISFINKPFNEEKAKEIIKVIKDDKNNE